MSWQASREVTATLSASAGIIIVVGSGSSAVEVSVIDDPCAVAGGSDFQNGSGRDVDPYVICSYAQLERMGDDLSAHYRLGGDISASGAWTPVGTGHGGRCDGGANDSCFQGSLNGAGFRIIGLRVNVSDNGPNGQYGYGGLFGSLGANALVRNVGLSGINITASASSSSSNRAYAGGLAGYSYGTISNSYATGLVTASSESSSSPPIPMRASCGPITRRLPFTTAMLRALFPPLFPPPPLPMRRACGP